MDSAFIHQAANELVQNVGTRNIKQIARSCSLDISETSRIKDMLGLLSLYFATVYKGNIIKNLIMDCQSYTKYRPNETTGGIFVSWRRKEELPTGA